MNALPIFKTLLFRKAIRAAGLVAAAALAGTFASAQATVEPAEPLLTLDEAIAAALERNLGLRVQRIDPAIAAETVVEQQAAFDPALFSRANIGQSELTSENRDGQTQTTTSDSRSYAAGITKRLVTGAAVTASAGLSRNDGSSFNSSLNQFVGGDLSERASLSLEVTQPLFRNRGKAVNLAPARRAESQERAARFQLRSEISDLLEETEVAYWRLSDTYTRRSLRESNLQLAEKLVEESRERERLGLVTQLEVLQAETSLAQRQEEIIRAEQAITEAADALMVAMGALDEELAIFTRPAVSALPLEQQEPQPYASALQQALERNFDTAMQEEMLYQLEQDRLLAKNSHRPELDVSLGGSYNGLSNESARDAFSQALDRRGDDWTIGLSFNLPWGRRASAANLRQADLRLEQAATQLALLKQDLLRSVRTAWRDVQTAHEQLAAATQLVALQEATYEQQNGLFEEGLSTIRNLLEIQRDLDSARLALLDARLASVQAEIRLARVEGAILERHGIAWQEAESPEISELP